MPLKEFADLRLVNGASFIYREDNSRYIGVQYSVEGRDLAGVVISWVFILPAPAVFSGVLTVCLALAFFAAG